MQLYSYIDNDNNLEAQVHVLNNGNYSVCLKDNDVNEILPVVKIFKDEQSAKNYAEQIVSRGTILAGL